MEQKYQYSRFYQKSDASDKANFSNWDVCYKFNPEKNGGVLFFYRNNSPNESMKFRIHCLDDNTEYRVFEAVTNKEVGKFSGKELKENGMEVQIPGINTAKVLGIEKNK